MNSSPLSEAHHFGGQELTLESPLPIHIPESSQIPVLQNQIDPIFNQTTTHMQQPIMASNAHAVDPRISAQTWTTFEPATSLNSEAVNLTNVQGNSEIDSEGDDTSAISYENEEIAGQDSHHESDTLQTYFTSSTAHPSAPFAAPEPSSTPLQHDTTTLLSSLSQRSPEQILHRSTEPQSSSQYAPLVEFENSTVDEAAEHNDAQALKFESGLSNEGVNYDTLLESLSPSTSTAPSVDTIASITAAAPSDSPNIPRPRSVEQPLSAFPVPAGLPPRPPPQEKPAIHPNYKAENDISTYHHPQTQTSTTHSPHPTQSSSSHPASQGYPHATPKAVGANGLPPPPLATFQQSASPSGPNQASPLTPQTRQTDGANESRFARPHEENDDEVPFTPAIEGLWSEFMREEAVYVSEGLWDRFPHGSRLFVGNLFTEKATKRDLFFVFHRYGKLAQISIKNAYGFVQYYDAVCCQRALQAEQGEAIRGRKMHLEVSKPQKNARNAAPTAAGDSLRAGYNKRARSPDYGRGPQKGGQRNGNAGYDRGVPPGGMRGGDLRRRDDYRPMRSPSPRGFRGRDEYRGSRNRSPDRYYGGRRSRSRSPTYGRNGRYRSRSPLGRDLDEEAILPFPRRDPRDVPEVQLILVDQVDRTFVGYIEKSFRDRGLRCDVLQLPRVSMAAVVKRQIIEGVQAVVKILRQSQVTGKIPLQVFDRRGGQDNVRFEGGPTTEIHTYRLTNEYVEYEELDANIAAELVVRAKSTHMAPQQNPGPPYPGPQYSQYPQQAPLQHQQQQQAPPAGAPNLAHLITSLDGPALQKLLGAMSHNPQTPQTPQNPYQQSQQPQQPHQPQQQPDLAALLNSVNRQPPPQQGYSYGAQQPPQQQQYNAQAMNQAFTNTPNLASLLGNAANRGPQPAMPQQQQQHFQPQQQHNVQNIIDQLGRYRQ